MIALEVQKLMRCWDLRLKIEYKCITCATYLRNAMADVINIRCHLDFTQISRSYQIRYLPSGDLLAERVSWEYYGISCVFFESGDKMIFGKVSEWRLYFCSWRFLWFAIIHMDMVSWDLLLTSINTYFIFFVLL